MSKRAMLSAILAVTIPLSSINVAEAQQRAVGTSREFRVKSERLSQREIDEINNLRADEQLPPLPSNTAEVNITDDLQFVAFDSHGRKLKIEDPRPKIDGTTISTYDTAMQNAAQAVVGCVAGVVGYDEILSILEKRVSKLTFVKFLAKRVGIGLALSCAGGAVASAMGWK